VATSERERLIQSSAFGSDIDRRLANLRDNASYIRDNILMQPIPGGDKPTTLYVWRALTVVHGECVSLTLARSRQFAEANLVQVTRRFSVDGEGTVQRLSSAMGLQAEEIAVFFGLDDVGRQYVNWTVQRLDSTVGLHAKPAPTEE
jgi:hypothetical protein